jgi:hypothetical protein
MPILNGNVDSGSNANIAAVSRRAIDALTSTPEACGIHRL